MKRNRELGRIPILNQPRPVTDLDSVLSDTDKRIPECEVGYAVVRLIDVERTQSGIIMPGTVAPNGEPSPTVQWVEVVATSGRYWSPKGEAVESAAQVGDRLILRQGCMHAAHFSLPPKHIIVGLGDVVAVQSAQRADVS